MATDERDAKGEGKGYESHSFNYLSALGGADYPMAPDEKCAGYYKKA